MAAVLPRALAALILASALVALLRGGGDHLGPPGRLPPVEFAPSTRLATPASPRNATAPLLCVVAPHRPREGVASAEPERFAAYLSRWLPRVAGARRHRVWIVEQRDEYRFNRGWLLNVGVAAARLVDGCDVFALHDVDLLPLDPRLPYASLPDVPIHLSPPGIHPEYVYPTFRGGAWLFTWEQLLAVDGYSHAYWGWGQEDDDLGARLAHARVVPGVPFPYPGPRPRDESAPSPEAPCTGRANDCDADPGSRDCGRDPYAEHLRLFRDVPGRSARGYDFPGTIPRRGVVFRARARGWVQSRSSRDGTERRRRRRGPTGRRLLGGTSMGRRSRRSVSPRRDDGAESARAGRVRRIGDRRRRSKSTAEGSWVRRLERGRHSRRRRRRGRRERRERVGKRSVRRRATAEGQMERKRLPRVRVRVDDERKRSVGSFGLRLGFGLGFGLQLELGLGLELGFVRRDVRAGSRAIHVRRGDDALVRAR